MTDSQQEVLFREIDEDLRRERYLKLWQQYGRYLIGLALLIVAAVAAYQYWQAYQQRVRAETGQRFASAVALAASDPNGALEVFRRLAHDGPAGYATLARLREAQLLVQAGKRADALVIYQWLGRNAASADFRDLATILAATVMLQDRLPANEAETLKAGLEPLAAEGNPWRFSARELLALIALQHGETNEARNRLTQLAGSTDAPPGIRQRAEAMLTQIAPH
jgi:hypothetical protein